MLQLGKEDKETRKKRINEEAVALLSGTFEGNIDYIRAAWEKEPQNYKQALIDAFDQAFCKAFSCQKQGKMGQVFYVCLFYLRSGAVIKEDNFMIAVYDELFYRNQTEAVSTWTPDFVMDYWKKDGELLEKKLSATIPGLKKYELTAPKINLAGDYYNVALEFVLESLKDIFALESYQKLTRTENVQLLYSGIHEPHIVLYETGKTDESDENTTA